MANVLTMNVKKEKAENAVTVVVLALNSVAVVFGVLVVPKRILKSVAIKEMKIAMVGWMNSAEIVRKMKKDLVVHLNDQG